VFSEPERTGIASAKKIIFFGEEGTKDRLHPLRTVGFPSDQAVPGGGLPTSDPS
jgi:hypothetical protein